MIAQRGLHPGTTDAVESRPVATLSRRLSPTVTAPTLRMIAMHPSIAAPASPEIDVRPLVPAQRHARIFQLVDALLPDTAFVLVNDHDPKPLYYQLEAEYPQQFSWNYLEKGPQVWRVEIRKLAHAA